jgi:hypothetical protein
MEDQYFKYRSYSEENYENILKAVPPKHYRIVMPEDLLAKQIYPSLKMPFVSACIATGDHTQVALNFADFEIPKGTLIVHLRLFREDNGISKAYETIIFRVNSGGVISVPAKYHEDRYKPILISSGLEGIMAANYLPPNKFGLVKDYTVHGATIPVVIDFGKQERERIQGERQEDNGYPS